MDNMWMDTRRLLFLRELARLGSMHEVAAELLVTTSTVSQQIAALGREVGSSLIEPDGRRVLWTPRGSTSIRTPNRPAPYGSPASPPRSGGPCYRSTLPWPCATPRSNC